ncbi:RICIN domain-containing protein [Streptomyces xanthophaeus]|uniref:RICIN domain-containing protein n=1 Tax=Streptomyces xanthophaeus TaxID=67385 RepID=UPI003712FCC0
MTDAHLCEIIRTGDPAASEAKAEAELRRRHLPRLAAFARTVSGDLLPVRPTPDKAMELFLRQCAGAPASLERPPRLALLAMVTPSSTGEGVAQYDPALLSFVSRGFAALSPRTQAVLWHAVVEAEPDDCVARITGDHPDGVADLTQRALAACRAACLRAHLDLQTTAHCPAYARLLDAAAHRADVRTNPDLTRHVDECPGCAAALCGLVALGDDPRTVLALCVLGAFGPAYLAALVPSAADGERTLPLPVTSRTGRPGPAGRIGGVIAFLRRPAGWAVLGTTTVIVTAVALVVAARPAWGPPTPGAASTAQSLPRADAGTVAPGPARTVAAPSTTATPRRSPTASPSPEASSSGAPTPGPSPSVPAPTKDPVQPFRASAYVRAVNSGTGLCLDVRGGAFANGADVVTTSCRDGASTQQWRLDEKGLLHNAANPNYCMDARGTTGDGVGIWSCSAFGTRATGENLVFSTDAVGRIRPRIAPGYAVTSGSSEPGAPVVFGPSGAAAEQHWHEPVRQ